VGEPLATVAFIRPFILSLFVRRFPPPWTAEDNGAALIVKDASGHALAYVYYELEPGRRTAANLLTRDEARGIAANIAKLPGLLGRAAVLKAGVPGNGACRESV
jgi:hypothetical protein